MNKNRARLSLAAVLMLSGTVMLAGCDDNSGNAQGPMAPEVGVVTLKSQSLNITANLPGRTAAYRIAEVRPQVSGIILKRNFTEGSNIEAGISLYQIDPATYQAAYNSAKASLAQAEASAQIANLTLKRYKPLLGTNYISKQDYDTASSNAQKADAAVLSAKAALETAKINLDYTKVTSPISGHVGKSTVTEGALVSAGQPTALAVVQQLDPIYVDLTQSSNDYLRLKNELANGTLKQENGKAKVTLLLDGNRAYSQTGELEFSDVTVDESTGSITLRAVFPNPNGELLPGMFVRAQLDEGVRENAILVPQQGVSRTPKGDASTMVVSKEGTVEARIIKADQSFGNKWLVTEGLAEGDKVIVSGLMRIRPGVPVKAKEEQLDKAAEATMPVGNTAETSQPKTEKKSDANADKPKDTSPKQAVQQQSA